MTINSDVTGHIFPWAEAFCADWRDRPYFKGDQGCVDWFLSPVRCRTRCSRNRARSRSARTPGLGSQMAGTKSLRASSASTQASIRSVLQARAAKPFTFWAPQFVRSFVGCSRNPRTCANAACLGQLPQANEVIYHKGC